ncbi:MAG: hypothetical protein A2275_14810 [Bacteroidetes bacterium RIFOXYA12_FULL_35_11]|nr:MAG: hypothetical protein A2X01_07670 [Bacteroidetes bacterium GWF2_35_48]OFY73259.1 MAG: hypothetical protein A2275_14810 [Bacteroidetes bacterium RIFOXYA12_FULL_35_11]OFY94027.1 MAG: hypothetical protein A2491_17055 [Bacteroidetes bacterium RIFOXYC12_FULL_35_7]OFY97636.1 MAG: hypothetical protein A2309_11680 [Bacteroidetes bacterium RIFOXYB2_FULL_35_7]HBX52932.1 hypothetical protein [Bacteroidales bacterium]
MIRTLIYFVLISLFTGSCAIYETASEPMKFRIEFLSSNLSDYKIYQQNESGNFVLVKPLDVGVYDMSIPMMSGGYSKILFLKYKNHDPNEYKVIQIKRDGEVYRELSNREIRQLKSEKNVYKLKLD